MERRAKRLAGLSLAELSHALGYRLPPDLRHHKGFIGQLVEWALGASAHSKSEPDFPHLGVELKTIPVTPTAQPKETTFVSLARLDGQEHHDFWESSAGRKLRHVLFFPIVDTEASLGERMLGRPFLWQPNADERALLQSDFEQLSTRIRLGELDEITAHEGQALQLRPKGATRADRTLGMGPDGWLVEVAPRAWYLRTQFTEKLIQRSLNLA